MSVTSSQKLNNLEQVNSSLQKNDEILSSRTKIILSAIVIIVGIGCLITGILGNFQVGSFSTLAQVSAIVLMATGSILTIAGVGIMTALYCIQSKGNTKDRDLHLNHSNIGILSQKNRASQDQVNREAIDKSKKEKDQRKAIPTRTRQEVVEKTKKEREARAIEEAQAKTQREEEQKAAEQTRKKQEKRETEATDKVKKEKEQQDAAKAKTEQAEREAKAQREAEAKAKADLDVTEKAERERKAREAAKMPEPFSSDKFRTDKTYRTMQLSGKSWFSNDSEKNKALILDMNTVDFSYVQYDQLPKNVQQDFYEALKIDHTKKQEFFSNKCSCNVIEIMDERDIAIIYGKKAGLKNFHYKKLTHDMKKKFLKSILENYNVIPDANPKEVCGFACKLLQATEDLSPPECQKEFELLFDLFVNTKFNLQDFFQHFMEWRGFNDKILPKAFPLFFVQTAVQRQDRESLILALFSPDGNVNILNTIASELTQNQKTLLKEIFNKQGHKYNAHLRCL